jgi:hypothetical protein
MRGSWCAWSTSYSVLVKYQRDGDADQIGSAKTRALQLTGHVSDQMSLPQVCLHILVQYILVSMHIADGSVGTPKKSESIKE